MASRQRCAKLHLHATCSSLHIHEHPSASRLPGTQRISCTTTVAILGSPWGPCSISLSSQALAEHTPRLVPVTKVFSCRSPPLRTNLGCKPHGTSMVSRPTDRASRRPLRSPARPMQSRASTTMSPLVTYSQKMATSPKAQPSSSPCQVHGHGRNRGLGHALIAGSAGCATTRSSQLTRSRLC